MNRQFWMVAVIAAALSIGYLMGNRGTVEAVPQGVEESGYFVLEDTRLGVFLVNQATGDTWRWFFNQKENRSGWQYFDRPSRIHTCHTVVSEDGKLTPCAQEPLERTVRRGLGTPPWVQ